MVGIFRPDSRALQHHPGNQGLFLFLLTLTYQLFSSCFVTTTALASAHAAFKSKSKGPGHSGSPSIRKPEPLHLTYQNWVSSTLAAKDVGTGISGKWEPHGYRWVRSTMIDH